MIHSTIEMVIEEPNYGVCKKGKGQHDQDRPLVGEEAHFFLTKYIDRVKINPVENMNEFDYIGTGGFLLICKEEEILGVTKVQADTLCRICPSIFFHSSSVTNGDKRGKKRTNTTLSRGTTISKPDWSIAVARHLIQLLITSQTTLPTFQLYKEISIQTDALQLDVRLCNFVNYMDPTKTKTTTTPQKNLELMDPSYFRFSLRGSVTSEQWIRLLDEEEILLNRHDTNYVIQIHQNLSNRGQVHDCTTLSPDQLDFRRLLLDSREDCYQVHAERSIHGLVTIQQLLFGTHDRDPTNGGMFASSSMMPPYHDRYTMYLKTERPIAEGYRQMIDKLAGPNAFSYTIMGGNPGKYMYTLQAPPDVLSRTLRPLQEEEDDYRKDILGILLCIDHPFPDTISRLINASLQDEIHESFKGVIGLNVRLNRYYFCNLPNEDVITILTYLADFSTSAMIHQPFTINLGTNEVKLL